MQHNGWDHALAVTADGNGLVGHAGGILLRKLADRCGLTAALDAAMAQRGTFPQIGRGLVLVSTAIAIAMGATAQTLTRIAQARARIRAHVWQQIQDAGGFPWLEIAGKSLAGWLFLDMDGTLINAYSDKEGAAPTWKKGFGSPTRWERGARTRASAWTCCCAPATPARTPSLTTRRCWPAR
ncbi:MAG: hypothetical protein JO345_13780 [Streptosporangiaceae bacterium]|nr:hypothetical protein [Streptosporangiaceae bacterium]